MPALVGGFGNNNNLLKFYYFFPSLFYINIFNDSFISNNKLDDNNVNMDYQEYVIKQKEENIMFQKNTKLRSYLAGLIEGDGTFAVHDTKSNSKKYQPKIIIVFKKADLPLARY